MSDDNKTKSLLLANTSREKETPISLLTSFFNQAWFYQTLKPHTLWNEGLGEAQLISM